MTAFSARDGGSAVLILTRQCDCVHREVRKPPLFCTTSPRAALRLFCRRTTAWRIPVLYRAVHLDDMHVMGIRCKCGAIANTAPAQLAQDWVCQAGHAGYA